jgi:hypothetical protein
MKKKVFAGLLILIFTIFVIATFVPTDLSGACCKAGNGSAECCGTCCEAWSDGCKAGPCLDPPTP